MREASDAIDHKIRVETAGVDLIRDTHAANAALERILLTISHIPSSQIAESAEKMLRQDQLLLRLSRQFGVDRQQMKQRLLELRSKAASTATQNRGNISPPTIDFSRLNRRETELIQLLVYMPQHLDTIVENIPCCLFTPGPCQRLYEHIDACFQNGQGTGFDELMLSIECPDMKNLLVYLDAQWHEKQTSLQEQAADGQHDLLQEMINVFRNLENESGSRKTISDLHQHQLNEQEEMSTLEALLNQTRQRHGL